MSNVTLHAPVDNVQSERAHGHDNNYGPETESKLDANEHLGVVTDCKKTDQLDIGRLASAELMRDDVGQAEDLLPLTKATERLALINEEGHGNTRIPGPASLHWTAYLVHRARPFSDLMAAKELLQQDPNGAQLCALCIFHTEGVVVGLRAAYLCRERVVVMNTHLSDHARSRGLHTLQSDVLMLQAGEAILTIGVAFDEQSVVRRVHVSSTHGRDFVVPPAGDEDELFVHRVDVLLDAKKGQPHARDLIIFCGFARQSDLWPGVVTFRRRFWPRYGWLVLWRARLASSSAPALNLLVDEATVRSSEMLAIRLVLIENEDIFRMVAQQL